MTVRRPVPLVRLTGEPFELGRQHGVARAGELRSFLDDGLARLNRLMDTPVTTRSLATTLAEHRAVIGGAVPALAEEIRGLAAGARITEDEALLLQLRREILGYRKTIARGDCTTYARAGAGSAAVLAQTVDLSGDLDDHTAVLDVERAGSPRRSLVLSFGGLLGYLGMNSDGLAVGLNLVLGGEWGPGVPPYLAIRHLLDEAGTVEQALALLRGLPLASSRSLTLLDRDTRVCVEVLGDRVEVVAADRAVHTNHFLHPDLAARDELNVFARNSSVRRLDECTRRLAELPGDATAEQHLALLSTPPLFVPDNGDIRRERTVATVVMKPAEGTFHLRGVDSRGERVQVFHLAPAREVSGR